MKNHLPRESKLVAPSLHVPGHGIGGVGMPGGGDQWIHRLKARSVFHIVGIAPNVFAPSISFVDDTLAGAVDLLDAVREGHLVRVGAVCGRSLCRSQEAGSTFTCVPVCHTAGSPCNKGKIERVLWKSFTIRRLAQGCLRGHLWQMQVSLLILQQF